MKTLKGGAMDSHLLLEIYNKQAKMIYFYLKKNGCSHEDARRYCSRELYEIYRL